MNEESLLCCVGEGVVGLVVCGLMNDEMRDKPMNMSWWGVGLMLRIDWCPNDVGVVFVGGKRLLLRDMC